MGEKKGQIKLAGIEHLPEIIAIENEVMIDKWGYDGYYNDLTNNEFSTTLIMQLEGKVIGYALYWHIFEKGELVKIAVAKDFQGNNYGAALLASILESLKNESCLEVTLEVRTSNTQAIKLYEKSGFKILRTRAKYYSDGEDAYLMIKEGFYE